MGRKPLPPQVTFKRLINVFGSDCYLPEQVDPMSDNLGPWAKLLFLIE